jgi:uncharacterized membrane protein HdeD (DUF308 family)
MKPRAAEQAEDTSYSNVLLFFGIAMIVLGIVAIVASILFTIGTVMLFGGILVAAGIAESIHTFRARHRKQVFLHLLSAIVYLVAGGLILCNPIAGAMSLTLILSAFLCGMGIIRCAFGISHRKETQWGWFLFGGMIDIALGVLIVLGWPVISLWVIGLFVGIEMITYGAACIALSTVIRDVEKVLAA